MCVQTCIFFFFCANVELLFTLNWLMTNASKSNQRDVYEFFSKASKVRNVQLIMDRNSKRSKGVGSIPFMLSKIILF
ncbi:probable RNA-binding protein 23 [Durio zibethinus]|uniref:Probable RNA-binding protein 23 n=1 Tax=Durio zibethinus TaxID=66656 RepID=A0A6P5ZZZ2_DURZI|nr:probable RNA-binding protein 23 [Durio zibethinus]